MLSTIGDARQVPSSPVLDGIRCKRGMTQSTTKFSSSLQTEQTSSLIAHTQRTNNTLLLGFRQRLNNKLTDGSHCDTRNNPKSDERESHRLFPAIQGSLFVSRTLAKLVLTGTRSRSSLLGSWTRHLTASSLWETDFNKLSVSF